MKKAMALFLFILFCASPVFALNPGEAMGYGEWDLGSTKHPWKNLLITGDITAGYITSVDPTSTSAVFSMSAGNSGDVSATTATDATAYAYTFTTLAGTLDTGEALRVTFYGTKTGANAAGEILLMAGTSGAMSEAAALTLVTADNQFHGEFIVNVVGASDALIGGFVQGDASSGATGDACSAEYTTLDFNASAVAISIGMVSGHASDTVAIYSVIVEQL